MSLILYVWVSVSGFLTAGNPTEFSIYYRATTGTVSKFSVTMSVENGKQAAVQMKEAAQRSDIDLTEHSIFVYHGLKTAYLAFEPVEYLLFDQALQKDAEEVEVFPILAIGKNGR
eukprot:GHVU01099800.1.p1 GENE.GHVU01099800.1~~GHVU01099800.1.p1  ORF type:complete len:115 (-),score=14.12 GHVU01099800.1:159-503(-)